MIEPTVSVIIPVFNGELLLKRCLDSVFSQKIEYDLDVIVIDDGSIDNSVRVVQSYGYRIRLIQQTNQGAATARNKGIDTAKGKYLAFLDADDYWLPDFLKETIAFLEKNPNATAVNVGQLIKIPGKPDSISPPILKQRPVIFSEPILITDFFAFWEQHNHILTGSVLMRTDLVKLTGGQRPELRITEDLEFWAYLATYGQWGFIPKVLYVADGWPLTKQLGWIEKNKKRWASALTIEEWEKRIVDRIPKPPPKGYLHARGRIAANLAYSMILSSRDELARHTIKQYGKNFPTNKLTLLLKTASWFYPLWCIVCTILRSREFSKQV